MVHRSCLESIDVKKQEKVMDEMISCSGNVWDIMESGYVSKDNISDVLLRNRGYSHEFLESTMKNTMPDPFSFIDMEKAVKRIYEAIVSKQPIVILGDYDVDGISSTSIFLKYFEEIGVYCTYKIPNRMDDGYGLNIPNIEKFKDHLIIAVDCGSSSIAELDYAKKNDIDLVVIDHHTMNCIPDAVAIVNPHRPDEKEDFRYLCATGLVFMCVIGLNRFLKEKGFFEDKLAPDLTNYLDLVALATVCDVVSLKGLNRAFVKSGLQVIRMGRNLGIKELLALKPQPSITSETIGYFIGPNLNAGGRIQSADIGVSLLTSTNREEASRLASEILGLNKRRQELELEMSQEAYELMDPNRKYICVYKPDWHVGVIGIVAGRLKEKYNKPTMVICRDKYGVGKASCRSIDGVDISKIVKKAVNENVMSGGGGHALAAGFSVPIENLSLLTEFLDKEVQYECKPKTFNVDAVVSISEISLDFVDEMNKVAPFGQDNPSPLFVIKNVKVCDSKLLKDQHVSVVLTDDYGNSMRSVCFGCAGSEIANALLGENRLDVLGELMLSSWGGRKYVNMLIRDVSYA